MDSGIGVFGACLSIALVALSGAYGLSAVGKAAMEGTARQPESAEDLRGTMLTVSGLIEGLALICALICAGLAAYLLGAGAK